MLWWMPWHHSDTKLVSYHHTYHDLANIEGCQRKSFAEKLFSAGIRNIEEYNEDGMTSLMSACN
jgi:hypothetical protein